MFCRTRSVITAVALVLLASAPALAQNQDRVQTPDDYKAYLRMSDDQAFQHIRDQVAQLSGKYGITIDTGDLAVKNVHEGEAPSFNYGQRQNIYGQVSQMEDALRAATQEELDGLRKKGIRIHLFTSHFMSIGSVFDAKGEFQGLGKDIYVRNFGYHFLPMISKLLYPDDYQDDIGRRKFNEDAYWQVPTLGVIMDAATAIPNAVFCRGKNRDCFNTYQVPAEAISSDMKEAVERSVGQDAEARAGATATAAH